MNTEDELIFLCDSLGRNADQSLSKRTVKAVKATKSINSNRLQIYFDCKVVTSLMIAFYSLSLTDDSEDKLELFADVKKEIANILNELKTDKKYLKELTKLLRDIRYASTGRLLITTVLLNTIFDKEKQLDERFEYVEESTRYILDGFNCNLPFVSPDTSNFNDSIEAKLELLKR